MIYIDLSILIFSLPVPFLTASAWWLVPENGQDRWHNLAPETRCRALAGDTLR